MDFHYEVTIKSSKNTIEFIGDKDSNKNEAITGVKFCYNSNNAAKVHDKDGRIEITLFGKFDGRSETLTAIKQLAEWAKSKDDLYREVTIVLTTSDNSNNEGNFSRTYHFDRMFCIDYCEDTGTAIQGEDNQADGLHFMLFMAQEANWKINETKAEII